MAQQKPLSHLFERPQGLLERMVYNIEKVIVGKREIVVRALVALLGGGHLLIEDVPGVGKTMLARAIAKTAGCSYKRIQFTPDLLPGDVTGISLFNQKTMDFEFRPGPVMVNLLLADELNRTSPKTQSALLECMEERRVTVDGVTYPLEEPFMVLATQNPLQFEGTYSLPEAQMDRFMMKIRLGYPDKIQEVRMLDMLESSHPIEELKPVLLKEELLELQQEVRQVFVEPSMKAYIVMLAHETRSDKFIRLGVSPRGTTALMRASQAYAWIKGRSFVIPDDIKAMAEPVLSHRLQLSHEAITAGMDAERIIRDIVDRTQIPKSGVEELQSGIKGSALREGQGKAVR